MQAWVHESGLLVRRLPACLAAERDGHTRHGSNQRQRQRQRNSGVRNSGGGRRHLGELAGSKEENQQQHAAAEAGGQGAPPHERRRHGAGGRQRGAAPAVGRHAQPHRSAAQQPRGGTQGVHGGAGGGEGGQLGSGAQRAQRALPGAGQPRRGQRVQHLRAATVKGRGGRGCKQAGRQAGRRAAASFQALHNTTTRLDGRSIAEGAAGLQRNRWKVQPQGGATPAPGRRQPVPPPPAGLTCTFCSACASAACTFISASSTLGSMPSSGSPTLSTRSYRTSMGGAASSKPPLPPPAAGAAAPGAAAGQGRCESWRRGGSGRGRLLRKGLDAVLLQRLGMRCKVWGQRAEAASLSQAQADGVAPVTAAESGRPRHRRSHRPDSSECPLRRSKRCWGHSER